MVVPLFGIIYDAYKLLLSKRSTICKHSKSADLLRKSLLSHV